VTAALVTVQAGRILGQFQAVRLAAELGCEVAPHPELAGLVEAPNPAPGIRLLVGTADEIRAEARAALLRQRLACLGTLGTAPA
jgi:hypothetical protein